MPHTRPGPALLRAPVLHKPTESMANKVSGYIQDVSKEMKKVHWPSQKELINNSALTLFAALMLAFFIYVADQGISSILEALYRLG